MNHTKLTMGKFRRFVDWAGEHPLLCAAVFFALSVAARLLCNSLIGPMKLRISPDEYRFLHIARSIADGGPLLILGDPTNYQKILYPLLISPAFLLTKDPLTQIKLVGIINILIMSSMVFPTALLAKKLTQKPSVLLLALAFAAALPDFIYTATFMGEVLYLPLSVWVFYVFHKAMAEKKQRKRLGLFVLLGLMTYLAYLTKEVGAAYLIAAAVVLTIETIRGKRQLRQNALDLSLCIFTFFAALFIVKQALFPGRGNTYSAILQGDYNHLSLSILKAPNAVYYLLFSTVVLVMAAILSFYILPVLLPLFGFGAMNEEKRRVYLFSVISLIATVGAVAYTISIREDLGEAVPRLHMRYLAPIAIPFVIICFDFLFSKDGIKKKQKRNKMPVLITAAVFGTLLMGLLPTIPQEIPALDHASLTASGLVDMFLSMGMGPSTANGVWIAFKLLMLAVTAAGVIFLLKGKKKAVLAILLCTISVVSMFDNFMCYQTFRLTKQPLELRTYIAMRMDEREPGEYMSCAMDLFFSGGILQTSNRLAAAAAAISCYIQQLDGVRDGSVGACMGSYAAGYIDTYTPQELCIEYIPPQTIREYLENGDSEVLFGDVKGQYIIVTEDYNPFANVEVIYEQAPYIILKNLDSARLCFK